MELGSVLELVRQVSAVSAEGSRAELVGAVASLRRLSGWCDARLSDVTGWLESVSPCPSADLADAGRIGLRQAGKLIDRSKAAGEVPSFAAALSEGAITAGHVDALAAVLGSVEADIRPVLAQRAGVLAGAAEHCTPERLRQKLHALRSEVESDGGEGRAERQRRAARCRTYVDDEGMWNLHARLDPAAGLEFDARLREMVDRLFADGAPADAPAMPGPRQDFLRAQALMALSRGEGGGVFQPDAVVVLNASQLGPGGRPTVDLGLPVELPHSLLARLLTNAKVWPVVVDDTGDVVAARGEMNMGDRVRLATKAQRRVLRGLHATCAVPGCQVRFDDCKVHHTEPWEQFRRTDLGVLLPLCCQHHTDTHAGKLILRIGPGRTVTAEWVHPP